MRGNKSKYDIVLLERDIVWSKKNIAGDFQEV